MSETEPGLAADDDRRNHYAELTVLIEDMLRRIRGLAGIRLEMTHKKKSNKTRCAYVVFA